MAQLTDSRLTDLSFGYTIDNALGELETDLAVILGVTTGVNYTSAAVIPQTEKATANGVATLNASSLVVQKIAFATTSGGVTAATGYCVSVATDWAYIHSSWGGTASSIATLNSSTEVVQNPANAVTAPGINKIVKADSATFSGGAFADPTWVGASMTAGAYKVVRADSTGAIATGWAGTGWAVLSSSQGLQYSMEVGGIGNVASPATGTKGFICTIKTPPGTTLTAGDIARIDTSDGKARLAIASSAASATGILVMALGTIASDSEGSAILWGYTDVTGTAWNTGQICYLSSTVSGDWVSVAPTSTGSIVRIIGYVLGNSGFYFDPDQTWIEL